MKSKNIANLLVSVALGAALLAPVGAFAGHGKKAAVEAKQSKAATSKRETTKSADARSAKLRAEKHAAVVSKGRKQVVLSSARTDSHSAAIRRVSLRSAVVREEVDASPELGPDGNPFLRSQAFLVQEQNTGDILLEKNSDAVLPIASITKLMTAMVVLDARLDLRQELSVNEDDVDTLRHSRSRLTIGTVMTREDMLRLALMSSENRAASALARHYPGGTAAFVEAMNRKALSVGLKDTHFYDSTGLNAGNVSSPRDLARMVAAASQYPLIREFSTSTEYTVFLNGRPRTYHNTNALVSAPDWSIGVSKTGFINESGKCLVMQAWFNQKPMIIVLLDSWGRLTRIGDANRIKRWIEAATAHRGPTAAAVRRSAS